MQGRPASYYKINEMLISTLGHNYHQISINKPAKIRSIGQIFR